MTPADPALLYAIYGVIVALVTAVVTIIVAVIKVRDWMATGTLEVLKSEEGRKVIVSGSLDALKSEDGRKAVIESILGSAVVVERIQKAADTQAAQALQPLLSKFDSLTNEVKGMRGELHAIREMVVAATDRFTDTTHHLDTRLQLLEREDKRQ